MSKDANPGELRTPIFIEAYTESRDGDGYLIRNWQNIFGQGQTIKVKWVNLHGAEAWQALSFELKDPATLTSRFTPSISETCRIRKLADQAKYEALLAEGKTEQADALCFEVISMDNVDEQSEWLEIRVQRMVRAK